MPRAASSAGACSRNRSACSTFNSSDDGSVATSKLGGDLDAFGERASERQHLGGQDGDAVLTVGDLDAEGGAVPHVVGTAPAAGVELVGDLEAHFPVVEQVVGQHQPDLRHDDGFAAQPAAVTVEASRQARQFVGVGEPAAEERGVGGGQGAERRAGGDDLGRA